MKITIILITICFMSVSAMAESVKPIHIIRFNDYETGSEEAWLQGKGFQFIQDAKRRNYIDLEISDRGLVLESKRRAFGILLNDEVNIPEFSYIEVDWGVLNFPEGASYEQGIRNEAIMLIIFMGDERHPSGSMFIPDSPYFIGLFLCNGDDRTNYPYIGSYFKKGGRYICSNRPKIDEMVTTRFNLIEAYRSYFDKENDDDPAISGISLSVDTKKAGGKGRSSAFIYEIRFFR